MAATGVTDFPMCADGDVCIVVSSQHVFKLHSFVLKRHSPFFRDQIDSEPPAHLNSKARQEGACSIRFELTNNQHDVGNFERKVSIARPTYERS